MTPELPLMLLLSTPSLAKGLAQTPQMGKFKYHIGQYNAQADNVLRLELLEYVQI